jgi:hypothetical protein
MGIWVFLDLARHFRAAGVVSQPLAYRHSLPALKQGRKADCGIIPVAICHAGFAG